MPRYTAITEIRDSGGVVTAWHRAHFHVRRPGELIEDALRDLERAARGLEEALEEVTMSDEAQAEAPEVPEGESPEGDVAVAAGEDAAAGDEDSEAE